MPDHKLASRSRRKVFLNCYQKPLVSLCGRIVPKKAKVLFLVAGVQ